MARITKKAALGDQISPKKKASKDSVPSEMFPGKMIPKYKSNYETGRMAKGMKPAPKKKMKDGGKAFPDLNKDGKVTKKDVLIGRGVLPKTASKGTKMKARNGVSLVPSKKSTSTNLASYKRTIGKSMRNGGSMKKCKYGCK